MASKDTLSGDFTITKTRRVGRAQLPMQAKGNNRGD